MSLASASTLHRVTPPHNSFPQQQQLAQFCQIVQDEDDTDFEFGMKEDDMSDYTMQAGLHG